MKYSKYFGTKGHGFIKSKSVLAPKGTIHLLNEGWVLAKLYFVRIFLLFFLSNFFTLLI